MNKLVGIVVLGSALATGFFPSAALGEYITQAEPSQHVMHIRKLTDSDKLRIELEPVWFHLDSTDSSPPTESQQVKRQAASDIETHRPLEIFPTIAELKRHQRKRVRGSRSEPSMNDRSESFLQHFWQVETEPTDLLAHELSKQSHSLEQQLEHVNLPRCFRKYLHEVYDRNNRSVRKLMRCLAQQSEESCKTAGRPQRNLAQPSSSQQDDEDDEYEHYPTGGRSARKAKRTQKYVERDDSLEENSTNEQLKFEQLFIRSDGDHGGQIFERSQESVSTEGEDTAESSSTDDRKSAGDTEAKSRHSESHESAERLYTREGRWRPVAYRRMPQKFNTRRRKMESSDESKHDSSEEEWNGSSEER